MPPRGWTSAKNAKSKVVTLHLSPASLSRFPSDSTPAATDRDPAAVPSTAGATPADRSPDESSANTPAPGAGGDALAPPMAGSGGRKKGGLGPKAGGKRASAGGSATGTQTPQPQLDAVGKARGKPGPKRKLKIDPNDPNAALLSAAVAAAAGTGAAGATAGPKLGPKANQGAINAGLRALDRSGRRSRRWSRAPFRVRSFTSVTWTVPAWRPDGERKLASVGKEGSVGGGGGEAPVLENGGRVVDGVGDD